MDYLENLYPYLTDYDPSLQPVEITKFNTGLSDSSLYKIKHKSGVFVLKVFPVSYKDRINLQVNIVDILLEYGITTPKILKLDYSFSEKFGYLVMEFIEGETYYHLLHKNEDLTEVTKDIAKTLVKIHSLPILDIWQDPNTSIKSSLDWITYINDKTSSSIEYLQKTQFSFDSSKLVSYLENTLLTFASNKITLCPLHWDFNPQNILVKNNKVVAVLDLESHRIGDPLYELGIVYYWYYFYDKTDWFDKFLEYYGEPETFTINRNLINFYMIIQVISGIKYLQKVNKDPKAIERLTTITKEFTSNL